MSGFLEDLSEDQRKSLQQFRNNLQNVLTSEHNDAYLLRWLRARHFNSKKAEKMLREHLKFRVKHGCDTMLQEWKPPEALSKFMIGGLFGNDRDGSPVWYDPFGCLDCKGIYYSTTKHDFLKYKIRACEEIQAKLRETSEQTGQRYERIVVVFDLENAGFSHLWRPFTERYSHVLRMYEANYPEQIKKVIIINAPKMFSAGYQWIKPLVNEDTAKKVTILDSNYKGKLQEFISPEELPVYYGGTATVLGDSKCRPCINFGGKVPVSYYLSNVQEDETRMESCHVSHGKCVEIPLQVDHPDSVLRYEFKTEKEDIGFGISLKESKSDPEIMSMERYASQHVPESGMVTCHTPGTYVVTFDNSYSWVKNKKVFYKIEVLPPNDYKEMLDKSNKLIK